MKITRPVTATWSPVAVSVGSSAYSARTSASVAGPGDRDRVGVGAAVEQALPLLPADPHLLGQVVIEVVRLIGHG